MVRKQENLGNCHVHLFFLARSESDLLPVQKPGKPNPGPPLPNAGPPLPNAGPPLPNAGPPLANPKPGLAESPLPP